MPEPLVSDTMAVSRLVARNIALEEAARAVTRAYTAESEDWNDGEFALWKADDLINAIVALRHVVSTRRCGDCGNEEDYEMRDGSWICHHCGAVS